MATNQQHTDKTPEQRLQEARAVDVNANPDYDTIAPDGSTDGVATTVVGSGANNGGVNAQVGEDTQSPSNTGTKGAATSRHPDQMTPSAQTSHSSGQSRRGDHGESGHKGSRSGNQQ